jgi:hypothetical protein
MATSASACEHTPRLEPLSPASVPAAGAENGHVTALLATIQREFQAEGPADPRREQLVAALISAVREPAPRGPEMNRNGGAAPSHIQDALNQLLASQGDSAAVVRVLEALTQPDSSRP